MRPKLAVLLLLCCFSSAWAQSGSKQLAIVNGEALTQEQVEEAAAGGLQELNNRRQQFEIELARDRQVVLEKTLKEMLAQKVLDAEAAKRGVSKDELLTAEVGSKVEVPSDETVKGFYEANKARIPGPPDVALLQIRQYLMQQKRAEVYEALISSLTKAYKVEYYLEPLRTDVASEGHPTLGPASARVTIIEFSDFECPFCLSLYPTLKQVESTYGDKVRLVFRQFPLRSIHPHAQKAAEASLCANDQQHFWDMHDSLFQDRHLDIDALKKKAADLQLDTAEFNMCLDSGKHVDRVNRDIEEGVKAGVNGTPAMFIDGRFLNGAQPYEEIAKIIDEELSRDGVSPVAPSPQP